MLRGLIALQLLVAALAQWELRPNVSKRLDVGTPPDVSTHKNLALLPAVCGRAAFSSRIVQGEKTDILEFPWMALLAYSMPYGDPEFKCGGSIINEKYILTAAHCVTGTRFPLHSVRVGEHNTKTEKDCRFSRVGVVCAPPPQDLKIEEIIWHKQYDTATSANDIGLLRVSGMSLAPANSKPVCLPLGGARTFDFANGQATVAGWGYTEDHILSPELLKVSLPLIPLDVCQRQYGATTLNNGQICAGGVDGRDSCGGDSGGPLTVEAVVNGQKNCVQQGIVSFGPKMCGRLGMAGVYTKVAMFMDWILDNLKP